jgi:phage-related protein
MALQTFSPARAPQPAGSAVDYAPRIRKAQLGDGYVQRGQDGLNANLPTGTWQWDNLLPTDMQYILDFLDARGAVEAFWWTPPDEVTPTKFTCEKWRKTFSGGQARGVMATFIKSADLDS